MRRAVAICVAVLCQVDPVAAEAEPWTSEPLVRADYVEPTARYAHGVLGDDIEYGALVLQYRPKDLRYTIRLPQERVFEDIAPRLADVDGDGRPEAVVVESHREKGARLAIYNGGGLVAATPYIGTRNRWLAPVGVADLDGDGRIELAYIDRPHLAKILRVWRYEDGTLTEIATAGGLTNHKIGWDFIAGGLRDCGAGPEMITADAGWRRIMASRFTDQGIVSREIGGYDGPDSLDTALSCP